VAPAAAAADPAADRRWLVPLVLFFVLKGVAAAFLFGPFTGHDEVDHFYYVARLAGGQGLGVVGEVDLPAAAAPYRDYVADYPTNAEVIQPPLYHLLLAPLYLAAPGGDETKLLLLRLVSVPLGAGVVWLAYRTARLLFPRDLLLRAGVPLFVAFQPQMTFVSAIVNHDVLLILLASLAVYLSLRGLRDGFTPGDQWRLGLIGAAGLWTKVSFGFVLPIVGLALLLAWWDRRAPPRELVAAGGRALLLPLVLILPWFARNLWLYGDPTAAARLRHIPGFGEQAQGIGQMLTGGGFWRQMLEDFWGNYGWRQVPYDPPLFRAVWLVWGLALLGLAVGPARRWVGRGGEPRWSRFQRRGVALLGLWVGLFIAAVLYVGTIQFTQARFAFPAMIGFALLTMLGLAGWLPARARPLALPLLAFGLMLLNLVVAFRFLLPFYYGPGGGAVVAP